MEWPIVSTAFIMGLLGSTHCFGMCGGIMSALSFAIPATESGRRVWIVACYNVGRISSYVLIGLLGGWLGSQVAQGIGLPVMRVIAGLLMIAMGLYLADWWRGLTYLEKIGSYLWRYIQPLSKPLLPVKGGGQAIVLGLIWGWLPCGLVYTALAFAIAQANVASAGAVMLAFGVGTLPAVMAGGLMADRLRQLLQRRQLRVVMGLLMIGFGVWTLWFVMAHGGHAGHQHQVMPGDSSGSETMAPMSDGMEHHHH